MYNRLNGYYETEEQRLKTSWEQTRWQTAALLNVYAKPGKAVQPKELITFPWEEAQEKADEAAILAMAERRWAKWDEIERKKHG